jgi:hypothetical protein
MDEEAAGKEIGMITELIDPKMFVAIVGTMLTALMLIGPFLGALAFWDKPASPESTAVFLRTLWFPTVGVAFMILFLLVGYTAAALCTYLIAVVGGLGQAAASYLRK